MIDPGAPSPRIETGPRASAAAVAVFDAHDFVWKHAARPYDLVIYQLGNAPCHDYMWPYVFHYPGLAVLHDGELHHARARRLLSRRRWQDYRAEFAHDHPDAPPGIANLVIAGLGGQAYYVWPMRRAVVEASRATAVHDEWTAAALREECPGAEVVRIHMGVADPMPGAAESARTDVRRRHGIPESAVVFAAFGLITPEKRIGPALGALAATGERWPTARLMLVGDSVRHHDALAEAQARGVADRVIVTGYVDEARVPAYLAAADVCLCLRWPTSHETSASWLRCLAAGKPTVITDLVHVADVPALDPRTWTIAGGSEAALQPVSAVAVAIDIMDEDHSLALAMARLTADASLRRALGSAARALWRREHTLEEMAADYRRAIALALAPTVSGTSMTSGAPRRSLPAHLAADGTALARRLAEACGVSVDFLSWQG